MAIPAEDADRHDKIHLMLRAIRSRKGFTLAEVGARTGLSVSVLSKLETGKISLTYDKLALIASGLDVDMAELFSEQSASRQVASGRRAVTRAADGHRIDTGKYLCNYLVTDLLDKKFTPILGEIHARSLEECGGLNRHGGDEFIFVIEGAIELHTELYAPVRLETGDCMYFDGQMAHAYVAVAPGPCRMLSINSAPPGSRPK